VDGEAPAAARPDGHAQQEGPHRGAVDGEQRIAGAQRHQSRHGGVRRRQVRQLGRPAAVAAARCCAAGQEGDQLVRGHGGGQRRVKQGQRVQDPVADPRPAGVQHREPRGQLAEAAVEVLDVRGAQQAQQVLLRDGVALHRRQTAVDLLHLGLQRPLLLGRGRLQAIVEHRVLLD
jgi:hypothetical protein